MDRNETHDDFLHDDDLRILARQQYATDELEIDEDAEVSRSTDRAGWVAAWVWVDETEQ